MFVICLMCVLHLQIFYVRNFCVKPLSILIGSLEYVHPTFANTPLFTIFYRLQFRLPTLMTYGWFSSHFQLIFGEFSVDFQLISLHFHLIFVWFDIQVFFKILTIPWKPLNLAKSSGVRPFKSVAFTSILFSLALDNINLTMSS